MITDRCKMGSLNLLLMYKTSKLNCLLALCSQTLKHKFYKIVFEVIRLLRVAILFPIPVLL